MDRPGNIDATTTFTETTVPGGKVHFGNHFGNIINYEGDGGRSTLDQLRSEALKALYWTDPEVDLTKTEDRTRAGRTPGTCQWVLENADFKVWQEARAPQLLLITGEPGIGKTVLATFLTDHFKKQSVSNGSDFAYFFCMNAEARQSTGLGILRGILLLLLRKRPVLCDHLLKDFSVKGEHLFDSIESLWPIFEAVITDEILGNLILQIDGLDECEETSRDLLVSRLGSLMRKGSGLDMKVVITSRVVRTANDLASHFRGATQRITMDVGKVNKDLQRFIEYEVDDIASMCGWDPDLKAEITEQVKKRDGGTFVWVSLALKTVSKKRPYQVVHELSKLPLDLQDLYARILHEIPSDERDVVYRVLVLVIGANRPMSLDELSIALCFYPEESGCGAARRRLPTDKEMDQGKHWVQTCAIFLRIGEDDKGIVRVNVFHLTLKEFLIYKQLSSSASACHIDLVQAIETLLAISTAYLLSEELDAIARDAAKLRDIAIDRYMYRGKLSTPLPLYSQNEENVARRKPFRLLKDKMLRTLTGRQKEKEGKAQKEEAEEPNKKDRQFELRKAWSEVEDRHLMLLESAYRIQREENEATAIEQIQITILDHEQENQACYTKHDFLNVLRWMIENLSPAAIHAICVIWHIMIVNDRFAAWPLNDADLFGLRESIAMAARLGRFETLETFVQLLPLQELSPRTMLAMAMQTFVPEGEPPVQQDKDAFDLLFSTARLDCISDGSSLLHSAAHVGCSYLVRCCIKAGDEVSARDGYDRTPLHRLANIAFLDATSEAVLCAQLILDAASEGNSLGCKDYEGKTPLHCAAQYAPFENLKLLIETNTDHNLLIAQDKRGWVPLHGALTVRSHDFVPCRASRNVAALLQADHKKKSIHILDKNGILPLSYAVKLGCLDCVKLLVEADVTRSTLLIRDRNGRRPLEFAQWCIEELQRLYEREGEEPWEKQHYVDKIRLYPKVIEYLVKVTADAQRYQHSHIELTESFEDDSS